MSTVLKRRNGMNSQSGNIDSININTDGTLFWVWRVALTPKSNGSDNSIRESRLDRATGWMKGEA